ncbi:MAG: DEAD/DEAH box helicase [Collinsella sp.]
MELVHGALDGGHHILLFSQFTGMLDIIGKRLAKEDIGFLKLMGASSKESRAKMVAQFQAGEVPVFLISLKAGGVGLNLTAADVVIHYDPWWNVAAQDQATDRAHRIGQQHTVTVYKLIAKDTIEERIMQMQESKRDLVNSVLGGDGISSALFTREDVLALLGGDGR